MTTTNPWASNLSQAQMGQMWNNGRPGQGFSQNGYTYTPLYNQTTTDAENQYSLLGYAGATPDQYKANGSYQYYDPSGNYGGQRQFENGGSNADLLKSTISDNADGAALFAALYGAGSLVNGGFLGFGGGGAGGAAGVTGLPSGAEADLMYAGGADGGATLGGGASIGGAGAAGGAVGGAGGVGGAGVGGGAGGAMGGGSTTGGASFFSGLANPRLLGAGLSALGVIAAGHGNGSAPQYPDPYQTAQAQLNANIQAANYSAGLNRVNQVGPYGSLTYTRTPGQNGQPDTWTANYALDPAQQRLLDMSNSRAATIGGTAGALAGNSQGLLSQTYDPHSNDIQRDVNMSGVPGMIGGNQLASDLQTQRNALYQQQSAYLDPQFQNQQHDLQVQLQNQGINQTTAPDAYNRAMDEFNRQRTFAYQQAMNNAITGGGQEQSRLFNIGLASNQNAYNQALNNAQFHNSAQQQNANEILAQRQQTMNELMGLNSMSQPTLPQFGTSPQVSVGAPDIASLINNQFNAQMGGYNAKVAGNNQLTSGLFNLGSALLMGAK